MEQKHGWIFMSSREIQEQKQIIRDLRARIMGGEDLKDRLDMELEYLELLEDERKSGGALTHGG